VRKLILTSVIVVNTMIADVTTIIPYVGAIQYDSNSESSIKDNANFTGLYTSRGNLNYLLEMAYGYTNINYKDATQENLKQHDITIVYGKYYKHFTWKAGVHYINNNEQDTYKDLGNGFTTIAGINAYNWFAYDKLTYGADFYYSTYSDAHNDISLDSTTDIHIIQFTPKLSYAKAIDFNTKNTLEVKANYIKANEYKDTTYISYGISNTFGYKSFFSTIKYNGGNMKSGIQDGGFTVYNSKALLQNSHSIKFGYYFTSKFEADISYSRNNYKEYDAVNLGLLSKGSNSIASISMRYSYYD